jgi:hypothetical protein
MTVFLYRYIGLDVHNVTWLLPQSTNGRTCLCL